MYSPCRYVRGNCVPRSRLQIPPYEVDAAHEMQNAGRRWSIEVELAQRLDIGRILGFAQRLGELLLQQIGFVLLRIDALPEDRLLAFVLFAHGLGCSFQVFEHALARRRSMAYHET